jgi:hypothetical protein
MFQSLARLAFRSLAAIPLRLQLIFALTDSSVQGGQNYYYVTTSVDSTGAQSSYSNEIQAVIPTP